MQLKRFFVTLTTLALAATTFSAAAPTGGIGGDTSQPGSTNSSQVRIVTTRERWGLSTDRAVVASVAADPYNQTLIGVPITEDEWIQITDRDRRYARVTDWAARQTKNRGFGGVAMDTQTGIITLMVARASTTTREALLTAVRNLVPDSMLKIKIVTGSLDQLSAGYNLLSDLMPQLSARGVPINSVFQNFDAHRIETFRTSTPIELRSASPPSPPRSRLHSSRQFLESMSC